jgi:hypothetical protein
LSLLPHLHLTMYVRLSQAQACVCSRSVRIARHYTKWMGLTHLFRQKMADHAHSAEELAPYTEEENKIYFIRESDWTQCPAYLFGQEGMAFPCLIATSHFSSLFKSYITLSDYLGIGVVVIQEWWGVNHQVRSNSPPESFLAWCVLTNEVSSLVLRGVDLRSSMWPSTWPTRDSAR